VRIPVRTSPTFSSGTPEVVLAGGWVIPARGAQYDVSPDGERILMIEFSNFGEESLENELVVVQNWAAQLSDSR